MRMSVIFVSIMRMTMAFFMFMSMAVASFMCAILPGFHLIMDILFTTEMEGLTVFLFTLDRGVEKFILLAYHIGNSLKCLCRLVRSNMASHAHLTASEFPNM